MSGSSAPRTWTATHCLGWSLSAHCCQSALGVAAAVLSVAAMGRLLTTQTLLVQRKRPLALLLNAPQVDVSLAAAASDCAADTQSVASAS